MCRDGTVMQYIEAFLNLNCSELLISLYKSKSSVLLCFHNSQVSQWYEKSVYNLVIVCYKNLKVAALDNCQTTSIVNRSSSSWRMLMRDGRSVDKPITKMILRVASKAISDLNCVEYTYNGRL